MNAAATGSDYCALHREPSGVGDFFRRVVRFFDDDVQTQTVGPKKVFVSFDFDNDRGLKDLILGQAKNERAPFEIVNRSLREAAPERQWEAKARRAISGSDLVLVLLGSHTYRAQGVLKEIAMARELRVKCVQLIGYGGRACPSIPGAGKRYAWTFKNLENIMK